MTSPTYQKIAIIGMGLIGGSIARAVSERHLAQQVMACDANELSLAYARKHAFATHTTTDPAEAVEGAQLVIIATPPSTLEDIAQAIATNLAEGALVMDVCSVKVSAIVAVSSHIPAYARFMPAHPIAGSQHSGVAASRSDMFDKKRIVLTPETAEKNDTLSESMEFWQALGGQVEAMPPHLHDLIYAYVSHLPQLLAFAAAHPMEDWMPEDEGTTPLHRFLRLCGSSTELWIDIFLQNRTYLITALDRYLDAVTHIARELESPPAETEEPPAAPDEKLARTILFPRIAASCLITTVMEAEKKAGFPFARYAGTGFTDFTSPALSAPDEDTQSISGQHALVRAALLEYAQRLRHFREAIDSGAEAATASALA